MSVTRLSGGLTPGDGADPRTFPAIWNATADYIENGFRLAGTRYYTSSGTFSKADPLGTGDIGLRAVRVRMVGGGGGGGGSNATGASQMSVGGGGRGGGFGEVFILASALSTSTTVTIGAGGAGNAGATGGTGGDTVFGSFQAPGGGGGAAGTADIVLQAFGAGGTGGGVTFVGTFDRTIPGQTGFAGLTLFQEQRAFGGPGGATGFAYGGSIIIRGANTAGSGGATRGAGGDGAASPDANDATAYAGGAGQAGLVIVECFA
jgi:hypothetical protein